MRTKIIDTSLGHSSNVSNVDKWLKTRADSRGLYLKQTVEIYRYLKQKKVNALSVYAINFPFLT